jgi:hypothetical protein
MRKITFVFIILGVCLLFMPKALADFDDGLVAYYPFNGNANDETGNGYDGTVNGSALTEDRFGNPQSAYDFDGNSSYIDIGTALDFPCGDYAVSVWFLNNGLGPHVNGYGQKIMSKATYYNDFWISVYTYGHADPYAGMLYWQQYQGSGSGPKGIADTDYDYMDSEWHHVVVNKNGSYGEMWVDGELIDTVNTLTDVCNGQHLYIGYTDHPDGYQKQEGHWNGKIDDIRIYDRVLSETEIHGLYLRNLSPVEKIAYIINYFEESVESSLIVGEFSTYWDEETALRRMGWLLDCASKAIENERQFWSCLCLGRVLKRCDGEGGRRWNIDYVSGESIDELAAMIEELMNDLGCYLF